MGADRNVEFTQVMKRYSDTVWRVCALYLKQKADAEDAFQNTFVRYATHDVAFESEEHRKAWLIRVASNICKDVLKSSTHKTDLVDEFNDSHVPVQHDTPLNASVSNAPPGTPDHSHDVRAALETLSDSYRIPLYLMYFEGYAAGEIAEILDQPVNTVYTNLARGRKALKEVLVDEANR